MDEAPDAPRAVVVLMQGQREVVLGTVDRATRCDLGLVDDLLRLQLIARRMGWSIRITEVRSDLRELFDLVGLTDRLDPES
jgi:ABC-type transporter Mla MlaB component